MSHAGDRQRIWNPRRYPRTDFVDKMGGEFYRTGDLLPEIHNFGHVAVSGLCRYRSEHFGTNYTGNLFVTEFNTHKIKHVALERSGSTYKVAMVEDFLVSDSIDFHPTDVLEDADGSLLVIDTGGWFRIGCPVSQVEKPAIKGAIWRVRRRDAKKVEDPWGLKMDWTKPSDETLVSWSDDKRWAVRNRALRMLDQRSLVLHPFSPMDRPEKRGKATVADGLTSSLASDDPFIRRQNAASLGAYGDRANVPSLLRQLARPDNDRLAEHAIIYALIEIGDAKATAEGLKSDNERVRNGARIALEQMQRKLTSADETMPIPPPAQGTPLSKEEVAKVTAFEALLKTGDVERGRKVFEAQKSGCTLCHRIGQTGAAVSQDLSKIGAGRSERDLIESILFPSASFARGFEPFVIITPDGEQHAGLIAKETGEAITLRHANNQEKKIFRNAISRIEAGKVSTMPGNYADLLTKEEIADLVVYLKSLK